MQSADSSAQTPVSLVIFPCAEIVLRGSLWNLKAQTSSHSPLFPIPPHTELVHGEEIILRIGVLWKGGVSKIWS